MANYYVTTSIPYVNAVAHVGHAMEFIQADVLARYHRQKGDQVIFSIGTDEHGGKNAEAAKQLGLNPQQHVDQLSKNFQDLAETLMISNDRFIRTTDDQHEAAAAIIWKQLSKYIYKAAYTGMYDQKEEEFITEEVAREIKSTDPDRYARLEELKEENYFFKLSAFTEPIKKAILDGSFRIVPDGRRQEVLSLLDQGLEDISISRPRQKLDWGVAVPGDKEHVMYVWFEAVMNYITVLGYPAGDDFQKFWPADVHVIGKDITRFHAAIWPAMLLGLDLHLPKSLYVHGFITMDGQKMSKSVGNVIAPHEIVSTYGVDAMRYYFLRHISSYGDGDFSWQKIESAYNGELGNELGNLVARLAAMLNKYQDGVIGELPPTSHDIGPYREALDDYRFDKALEYTFSLIRGANQYVDEEKPWKIAAEDSEHLQVVLATVTSSVLQIAQLLEPFIPLSAQKILTMFESGVVKNADKQLFPRIELHS
jgi:methionyl-tRNA synthetase